MKVTKGNLGINTCSEAMFKLLTPRQGERERLNWIRGRSFCSRITPQHILPKKIFKFRFLFEDAEKSPWVQREMEKENNRDLTQSLQCAAYFVWNIFSFHSSPRAALLLPQYLLTASHPWECSLNSTSLTLPTPPHQSSQIIPDKLAFPALLWSTLFFL